ELDVDHVYINKSSEGNYISIIIFAVNVHEQDACPSDAIAFAVRFGASIYVDSAILDEAGILSESEEEGTISKAPQSQGQTEEMTKLEQLENELQTAIDTENYEKAARLRDEIQKLKS